MKLAHGLFLILTGTILCTPVMALQDDEHKSHHPTPTTEAANPAPAALPAETVNKHKMEMAHMDAHMKHMRDMHEKMINAKTTKARKALMDEHMKIMQEGMKMMSAMSSHKMEGMDGMGMKMDMKKDMPAKGMDAMKDKMAMHHEMMEKRMEMMQMMMQMMVDRLSEPSSK